jgi:peptidoglycan/LPS O-acetylase OafA/YrhL
MAWFEVCHGWAGWRPRSWSWWITLLNLIGSVAFGVSAVAGYISPATGQLRNAERANLGTFIGAVCFLAGALLLLPERTEESK